MAEPRDQPDRRVGLRICALFNRMHGIVERLLSLRNGRKMISNWYQLVFQEANPGNTAKRQ